MLPRSGRHGVTHALPRTRVPMSTLFLSVSKTYAPCFRNLSTCTQHPLEEEEEEEEAMEEEEEKEEEERVLTDVKNTKEPIRWRI